MLKSEFSTEEPAGSPRCASICAAGNKSIPAPKSTACGPDDGEPLLALGKKERERSYLHYPNPQGKFSYTYSPFTSFERVVVLVKDFAPPLRFIGGRGPRGSRISSV
ncbi:hypothetical protein CDAR_527731 [Caerostris darwini]|uniref:Uncharacterized protein n=1 Tax=Caerostris darwini TaxID=1538125 RepID=A0AAV4RD55_9ARAC|nr:hypothetical protein CDAR_527731 [Caerostris darwini]